MGMVGNELFYIRFPYNKLSLPFSPFPFFPSYTDLQWAKQLPA
jgi:hypothetical protein